MEAKAICFVILTMKAQINFEFLPSVLILIQLEDFSKLTEDEYVLRELIDVEDRLILSPCECLEHSHTTPSVPLI